MKNATSIHTRASAGTAVWNFSESGSILSPISLKLILISISVLLREIRYTYVLLHNFHCKFLFSGPMHEILWQQGAVDSLIQFLSSEEKDLQKVAVGALFGLLDYGIIFLTLFYDMILLFVYILCIFYYYSL